MVEEIEGHIRPLRGFCVSDKVMIGLIIFLSIYTMI